MRDLVGKTTFVTVGASGIGLAIGRTFAEAGMQRRGGRCNDLERDHQPMRYTGRACRRA